MTRFARRCMTALVASAAGLLMALPAAAEPAGARVARLTDLVVETVPMGEVLGRLAATNPDWPLQENPDLVSAGQLACLRDELSEGGYRRMKRTEVVAYVAEDAARADADIALLEAGAAWMMRQLMLAGVEEERTGIPFDEAQIMAQASEAQLGAFMQMMTGEEQASLRVLLGIGEAYDAGRSADENEAAGEQAGGDLATRIVLKAMANCSIPTSVLFN
ncbi:MAG TPA: hypothetical protein VFQ84_04150 [Arenimonas sp.]|uniref:hypothetical protein n=1 Tax=Arenimonas sp. TaxID=1872635 RepID=UPI002D80231C|nr:hypothetical protein [Arenimonas sp.]HEU0152521.1 hypothetical protein [Arenimonas sp.]